jgi:NAD(P)-dependent dehydrogenase (short-subunit alcohol dehydrogenase family)
VSDVAGTGTGSTSGSTAPLALVVGGSRGLGLAAARQLADRGYRLVLTARNAEDLERAADQLRATGADVEVEACDVRDEAGIEALVALVEELGPIEVLLHVAGVIQVGPLASLSRDDFREAIDIMLWGPINTTLSVSPLMVARGRGRIGVVTSVGGLIPAPHLLPYSTAKFGATGYARGLRSELAGTGVTVTTIEPGLMRTGSHLNAQFVGEQGPEFAWFSAADNIPLLSMDADRAAAQIVDAVLVGRAVVQPTPLAKVAQRVDALAPNVTSLLLGAVTRLLPNAPASSEHEKIPGHTAQQRLSPRAQARMDWITTLGRRAAGRLNQTTRDTGGVTPEPPVMG